ncbi:MAG: sigma-70 family RNA polymerase sigma factor [Acidobacteria bacterium]|nr:sigma-70 family RNA polymerase sigma factor [Acidobacteriota bacterium]
MDTNDANVHETIDHLFRQRAGQMVSLLSRTFGIDKLELIEDAVQEAMIAAMRKWPFGIPENPSAWLIQTARNKVIDDLRRNNKSVGLDAEDGFDLPAIEDRNAFADLADDELRMIFACCSPAIAADSRVALTLKIVGGFSVQEIARAFLSNDEAVAKMLTRAKKRLREDASFPELPSPRELPGRLDAVLRVLYLMFNEGFGATSGDDLFRSDMCFEAIRLAEMLLRSPETSTPKVHALAALFYLQAARLPARTNDAGDLVLLEDQDRSRWNMHLAEHGVKHLHRSASGDERTEYHLESEIAGIYTLAPSFAETDWPRILACYDELQRRRYSDVVELNRLIVLAKIEGAERALGELDTRFADGRLERFYLYQTTRGHFLAASGRSADAEAAFTKALALTDNTVIRRFLIERIARLSDRRDKPQGS